MRTTKLASFALISVLFLILWGCGSSRDSSKSSTGDQTLASAPTVGINTCVSAQCHAVDTGAVAEWKEGVHANQENFPDTTYFGGDAAECTPCHDQTGDSENLIEDGLFDPLNPKVLRPVVGCESCHGGGQFHFGIVSGLPFATPDYDRCGQCHNETFDHNTHHPFADSIVENYKAGAHINSIEAAHATPESISAKCGRCHSDEGFRQFYPLTVDYTRDQLNAFFDPLSPLTDVNPVQCRTCHDSHTGELRATAVMADVTDTLDEDGNALGAPVDLSEQAYSVQFKTCTACHNVFINETFDEVRNKFDYVLDAAKLKEDLDGTRNNHYHGFFVDMVQTHFDNPDTMEVEGYNINAADENACLNCHDGHAATKFEQVFASGIATEWGNEEHFHGDYKKEAFNHGFDETDAVCMECHNGTEAVKVMEGLEAADLDGQPGRVVACVTCHDLTAMSADGTAFELGARRQFKDGSGEVVTTHTFESGLTVDLGADDVDNVLCLNCHSGRESKMSIDDEIAADDGPYGFINIHYRAAGATLFGSFAKGAYEYDDKVYAAKNEHVSSNDLCIECHSAHEGKLFIASPGFGPTGCSTCHTNIVTDAAVDYDGALDEVRDIRMYGSQADYDGDGDAAEGMYYEIYGATGLAEQLLDEIKTYAADTVGTAVVYDAHAYPYFFIDTNGDGITDPDEVSYGNRYSLFDATLLKAAYNYQVSQKDTGAYAHNPTYIIEVLYDSIEDLGGDVSGLARDDVGHFAAASEPFRHWDEDDAMSTNCGKCHSSEGAAAFFAYGVVTSDDFKPYTRGVSSGLACESCHVAPFDGTLRTQSAVTFPSGVVVDATTDGAADLFAAGNDSPLCMTCHQGRSSTDTLDARIASGNLGFSNIHYYAAAASFFGSEVRGGYQYSGKTYAGTMTYPGSHSFAGLTTCEGCHMDGEPSHDFKPVAADCAGCHEFVTSGPGEDFKDLGDGVSENYDDIQTLKSELESLLKASGVTFLAGYPYFSNITTAAELRAAYNWQVADKEPCGYIHNPDYMMQLLYDSIEDMGGVPSVSRPSPDET